MISALSNNAAPIEYNPPADDPDKQESKLTILNAFASKIMHACEDSALGNVMLTEMQRFVEILEMYKPIAEFPIQSVFKLSRFEEGLPKSIIL